MSKVERGLIAIVALLALSMAWAKVTHLRAARAAEPLAAALHREAASGSVERSAAQTSASTSPRGVDVAARFVVHREHVQPGLVKPYTGLALHNPYANDPNARALGAKLFVSYNCADCHGSEGSGFMAPSLQDGRWHFGGSDEELFESIYEGRPDGMPAWGSLISQDQIWTLVSYVRTLQSGKDVTTEDFTGRTVERMGH